MGIDILDKRKHAARIASIKIPFDGSAFLAELHGSIMDASGLDFRSTVEQHDLVEFGKFQKFFAS
jgi:hypothetical protein